MLCKSYRLICILYFITARPGYAGIRLLSSEAPEVGSFVSNCQFGTAVYVCTNLRIQAQISVLIFRRKSHLEI